MSDELALGNLGWPRSEKVGVAGIDRSDVLDIEPLEACAHIVVLVVMSSLECDGPLRSTTIFGKVRGLSSRIVIMDHLIWPYAASGPITLC